MRTRDIVRRAGRSLAQAKARTLLTSLAIAVGAFTLTISIAAGEGSRQYADKLIGSNINPRSLFIVKDKVLFEGNRDQSGLQEYDPDATTVEGGVSIKRLTQKDIDALKARGDIEDVQPMYQLSIEYLMVEGSDTKFVSDVARYDASIRNETSAGQLPPLDAQIKNSDIVMPESFADVLVKKHVIAQPADIIGKKVTLVIAKPVQQPTEEQIRQALLSGDENAIKKLTSVETKDVVFTVRALTKQSSTSLAFTKALQVSPARAQAMFDYVAKGTDNYRKYTGATALAKNGHDPAEVKKSLGDAGYPTQTAKDLQNLLFTIVNILQGIVAGFGVLALIASVFGIINTQYISVLERTQQIGLMKALGMRSRHVAKLFRYEAAWIGFLGGVIGSGIAWVGGTALNPWITKQLDLGEGNYLLVFQPLPVIGLIIALMVIAVVAGYFPARKAAKLDPIEALRTE